jgi:hypothetical protein
MVALDCGTSMQPAMLSIKMPTMVKPMVRPDLFTETNLFAEMFLNGAPKSHFRE